jgi:hypothetical protein
MAKKQLNTEEIAELRESPFVSSIISGRIQFTPEFKRMAYQQPGRRSLSPPDGPRNRRNTSPAI